MQTVLVTQNLSLLPSLLRPSSLFLPHSLFLPPSPSLLPGLTLLTSVPVWHRTSTEPHLNSLHTLDSSSPTGRTLPFSPPLLMLESRQTVPIDSYCSRPSQQPCNGGLGVQQDSDCSLISRVPYYVEGLNNSKDFCIEDFVSFAQWESAGLPRSSWSLLCKSCSTAAIL